MTEAETVVRKRERRASTLNARRGGSTATLIFMEGGGKWQTKCAVAPTPPFRACACELRPSIRRPRPGGTGRARTWLLAGRPHAHARSLARRVVPRPRKETNFNGFQAIWTAAAEGWRERERAGRRRSATARPTALTPQLPRRALRKWRLGSFIFIMEGN